MSQTTLRFHLTFTDGSFLLLFGQEMWGDKRVFYVYHLNQLDELCGRVATCGFPIEVEDRHTEERYQLDSTEALNRWLAKHHPRSSCE